MSLSRVLARICELDRVAFILRFIHGLPVDEIAEVLRTSQATARRRFRRARARMLLHARNDVFLSDYEEMSRRRSGP